jgi:allene oxide cyclase-like protein
MSRAALITAALLVAGLAAFSAPASAGAQTSVRLVATQHDFHQIGMGKKGPAPGSMFVFSEKLARAGRTVGADHVVCTFTGSWPSGTDFCRAVFQLNDGAIVAEGVSAQGPFTVAVIGGTGRYRGARGTVHSTPTKTGEILAFTLSS